MGHQPTIGLIEQLQSVARSAVNINNNNNNNNKRIRERDDHIFLKRTEQFPRVSNQVSTLTPIVIPMYFISGFLPSSSG